MTGSKSDFHIVCQACDAINRIASGRMGDNPICGKCGKALFSGHPVTLTARNFSKHVSRSDIPVVVDFWAPWCAPCKLMAPEFEKAAGVLEPNVRLAKLNTESEQSIGAQYGIRSIPTMVVFKSGKEIARQAGAMGMSDIVRWIKAQI
ncbi:MAG: thioredoxin TrxC [Emcibacteraceae bacterium]